MDHLEGVVMPLPGAWVREDYHAQQKSEDDVCECDGGNSDLYGT